jgi:hypothetical protein
MELVQQGLSSVERGYYLTFPLPRARALLEAQGFRVDMRRALASIPLGRE